VVGELAKLGLSRKALDDLAAMDVCGAYRFSARCDRRMLIWRTDEEQIVEETLAKLSFAASAKFKRAVQEVKQVRCVPLDEDLA
jgi:hypothetical protein